MRSREEILKRAKARIEKLEYFDRMIGLNNSQRADLELMHDLVALIEAQPVKEPVAPHELIAPCKEAMLIWECPSCGQWIYDKSYKFCHECGQEFK